MITFIDKTHPELARMSRRWKAFWIATVAAVAIAASAAVALAVGLDTNLLKSQIENRVTAAYGRTLKIGSAHLSYFPIFGARLDDLQLGEPAGFPDTPFATVSRCAVSVKLLPLLLHRQIQIGKVELTGVGLHLIQLPDGQKNWTGWRTTINAAESTATPPPPSAASAATPSPRNGLKSLAIDELSIRNAAMRYEDLGRHRGWTIEQLNLGTKEIHADQPIEFTLGLIAHVGTPETTLKAALAATFTRTGGSFSLDPLQLQIDASGARIPEDLGSIFATGGITSDSARHSLNVRADQFSAAGVSASFAGNLSALGEEQPGFHGKLSLTPFSPRALLARLHRDPPRNSDPKIYSYLAFKSDVEIDSGQAMLHNIVAQLDSMHVDGWVGMTDRKTRRYGFGLGVDSLDIDRYRARAGHKAADDAGASRGLRTAHHDSGSTAEPIDIARLDRLNGSGSLNVGQLIFHSATIEQARMQLDATPGGKKSQRLTGHFYGGTLDESTEVSPGRSNAPVYRQQAHLASVDIGRFLHDATQQDKLDGVGNADLDFVASGATRDDLRRSLSGPLTIQLHDVVLKGVGLEAMAKKGMERGLGGGHGGRELGQDGGQTRFSDVSLDGQFDDGILDLKTLQAVSDRFQLKGHGSADFVQRQLNLHLDPKISSNGLGPLLSRLSQMSFPFLVSGPFDHPQFKLDESAQSGSTDSSPASPGSSAPLRDQLRNRLRGLLGGQSKDSQQQPPNP